MSNSIYSRSSPYSDTDVTNQMYLDIMVDRPIPKLSDDAYWMITTKYENRPDLLAFDLYHNSKLWWVFASRNPDVLLNPLNDFITGTYIYIPKQSTLSQALGI
jgi:hypothetical protein